MGGADGPHISVFCQMEQVANSTERAALSFRPHQHGQVPGRGLDPVYVVISPHPYLDRVLDAEPGGG